MCGPFCRPIASVTPPLSPMAGSGQGAVTFSLERPGPALRDHQDTRDRRRQRPGRDTDLNRGPVDPLTSPEPLLTFDHLRTAGRERWLRGFRRAAVGLERSWRFSLAVIELVVSQIANLSRIYG